MYLPLLFLAMTTSWDLEMVLLTEDLLVLVQLLVLLLLLQMVLSGYVSTALGGCWLERQVQEAMELLMI